MITCEQSNSQANITPIAPLLHDHVHGCPGQFRGDQLSDGYGYSCQDLLSMPRETLHQRQSPELNQTVDQKQIVLEFYQTLGVLSVVRGVRCGSKHS